MACAAGEQHFLGRGIEEVGYALARIFQSLACLSAGVMTAGGVARMIQEIRPHGLPDRRQQGSGGVVIEVDEVHVGDKGGEEAGRGMRQGFLTKALTPAAGLFSFYFVLVGVVLDRPTQ